MPDDADTPFDPMKLRDLRTIVATAALLAALYVLAFSLAHASSNIKIQQPCEGPFDKAITAAITSTKDLNSKILSRVETVPPGMAEHIKGEVRNSVQQKRVDHYLDLMSDNQFYWPVQIDDELKSITDWLELALSSSGKSAAGEKLSASAMLQAISSYSDLMNDIYVYAFDDARRPKPYLSESDGSVMFTSAQSGQEVLVKLLACMLVH
jgi:hypothetical protein